MSEQTPVSRQQVAIVILSTLVVLLGLALRQALQVAPEHPSDPRAKPSSAGAGPGHRSGDKILVVDLSQRIAQWERERADASDTSQSYFASPTSTIHVHALGFGQMTPLHIHRKSDEVAVVVSGRPHVLHVYGHDGAVTRSEADLDEGTLIHSPPLCGHEWTNPASDHVQANLVFSTPGFDGNLFVKPEDARLAQGPAPMVWRPDAARQAFVASKQPFEWVPFEGLGDRVAALFVQQSYALPPTPGPVLLYVVSGQGTLRADQAQPLRARSLAMLPPGTRVTLEPSVGQVLSLYVVRPK